jgi:3-hydroxyisobutyrate dehydrogenase
MKAPGERRMRIGFVGLGAMGMPMALQLVAAGHAVRGFDRRPAALQAFAAQGGEAAASARDAAEHADLLWLMVVNGEQAEAVLFGPDGPDGRGDVDDGVDGIRVGGMGRIGGDRGGAAAALPRGAVVVAGCTQSPEAAQRLASRVGALGGPVLLDAPVSGGVAGAQAATLSVMCSGPAAAVERARPAFEAVAARIFHVGEQAGLGSTAKLINQLLCGVHIAAAAEAMHVAERAGLPLPALHEIISVSAGNSWMWGDRGPRMMTAEPPVTSAVDIFVKDLGIVLDQGRRARQGLPLAAAAMQMFLAASGLGHGAADDSQVIRAYRALNGKGMQ